MGGRSVGHGHIGGTMRSYIRMVCVGYYRAHVHGNEETCSVQQMGFISMGFFFFPFYIIILLQK